MALKFWPFNRPQPSAEELRQKDLEAVGKQVMVLYDHINPDRKGLYRTAFMKGMVTGVGTVVGATLVIALVAWLLSLFQDVPFVGPITDNVQNTIENR